MNPSNARIALEIRLVDDLIASLSKYLLTQKASKAEQDILAVLENGGLTGEEIDRWLEIASASPHGPRGG